MNLVDVMEEIGSVLDTIPGLHVYTHPVDSISPPAAIVQFPTFDYDQAFQRGLDRWEGGVMIAVSRVWDRAARNNAAPLVDAHSSTSVHAVLRAHDWVSCSYARATGATWPSGVLIGGVPYVTAEIALDIAGPGT